jgi:hypothetical protein
MSQPAGTPASGRAVLTCTAPAVTIFGAPLSGIQLAATAFVSVIVAPSPPGLSWIRPL